jgi:hypothetical protein
LKPKPALQRWLWFIALWVGGVAAVTALGLVIRLFLAPY